MRRLALSAYLVGLAGAVCAAPRWTFCVATANGASDIWITDVFQAGSDREKLEGAFKCAVERLGAAGADVQCPSARDDKTVAVNAQIDAEACERVSGTKARFCSHAI